VGLKLTWAVLLLREAKSGAIGDTKYCKARVWSWTSESITIAWLPMSTLKAIPDPTTEALRSLRALATKHRVAYVPTESDRWADKVNELSDNNICLGEVELLALALYRVKALSKEDANRHVWQHFAEVESNGL